MHSNRLKYLNTIILCILLNACATRITTPPPDWSSGKPNDAVHYYGVGRSAETMAEAERQARVALAETIEVTIEAEFIQKILETNETFQTTTYERSRSYTLQNLQGSEIVKTYTEKKSGHHYALARIKRQTLVERMEAPIREVKRDVLNHLRRGKQAQANGHLIDALTEFGQGWQKALTLPRKYNWLDGEKTERDSEHLEGLLNQLVRGVSLRCKSAKNDGAVRITAELQLRDGTIPLKHLDLIAFGERGQRVRIKTDETGQAWAEVQTFGNRLQIALDENQIDPLISLIQGQRVSSLKEKTASCHLFGSDKAYRIAVLPFKNIQPETDLDWVAKFLQSTFTNYLTQVNGIDEVLTRLALPDVLKEYNLQMSDLIDPRTAVKIGKMQGATHIITGTYTAIKSELHISARLVDVQSPSVLFAMEERGKVIDPHGKFDETFFQLADRVAHSLITQMDPRLSKETDIVLSGANVEGIPLHRGVRPPLTDPALGHFKQALHLQNQAEIEKAIALYTDGLKLDPYRAEAYNNLGICYRKQGHFQQAQEAYETAIRLKPHFPEVYNNVGWLLLEIGDVERAIDRFKKGLALAPKTRKIWTNLAWAYYVKGDYPKAIETNRAILKEYATALYPRYNLALAYLCNRNFDNAEQEYKTAYRLTSRPDEPAYVSAVNDLQNLLKNGNRPREAQRMLALLQWQK